MYISKNNQIFKKIKNLGVPSNNSKNIKETGVFFVIKGEKTDGSLYIKDAIKEEDLVFRYKMLKGVIALVLVEVNLLRQLRGVQKIFILTPIGLITPVNVADA